MKSKSFLIALMGAVLVSACSNEDTKIPLSLEAKTASGDQKIKEDPAAAGASKSTFEANLSPILKSNCASCHSPDGFGTAPASVFQVTAMEALAKKGTSATDNDLIKKLLNQITHGGGNVCPKGTGEFPCAAFVDWSRGLYSSAIPTPKPGGLPKDALMPTSPPSALDYGYFRSVDLTGQIDGFAFDKANPTLQVPIEIYTAPYAPGATPLASAIANNVGSTGGVAGNHRFALNVAANLAATGSVTLYVYAVLGDSRKAIADSPKTITIYKKSPGGRPFFDGTLKPILAASCEGCHGAMSYESMYLNLLNPTPLNGGTATNNLLYRKASGGAHSGGNVCASNAQVCPTIVNWFNAEFP